MSLHIAVQMDHPTRLNAPRDSTLMLIEEAQHRGHQVSFYEAPLITWKAGEVTAPLQPIRVDMGGTPVWKLGAAKRTSLHEMDVVLMRQDPPFHMAYITATHLLEQLLPDVAVWNNPTAVRNAPEKLSILGYEKYMPRHHDQPRSG